MIKNKNILGFVGSDGVGKTTAANYLKQKGFYRVSILSKVEEFCKHLFPKESMKDSNRIELMNSVRKRGYSVSNSYWINLVMASIPDKKGMIVFDDLMIEDVQETDFINVYQIYRPRFSKYKVENMEVIDNNGTLADFIGKIDSIYRSITKNS